VARSVSLATDAALNKAAVRDLDHAGEYYVKNGRMTNAGRMIRVALRLGRERFGDLEARDVGLKGLNSCQGAHLGR
jgi:hypothetical protein